MKTRMKRRQFLRSTAFLSTAAALHPRASAAAGSPKKAVLISMLPKDLSYLDRFRLAVEVGFAGIEMQTVSDARSYFDVGNVVFYGYPQDWIRTLGGRIVRVHLKDFSLDRPNGRFAWKNLGEGDIDWPAVRQALEEIGYDGWMTTEISGGDAAYLRDVVARFDRFLAGQRPHPLPSPSWSGQR